MESNYSKRIEDGENKTTEFKSTFRVDLKAMAPDKKIEFSILKTIAAFLNSDGGLLFIGVDDEKRILGLEKDYKLFQKGDKRDEFQQRFDNLISKQLGDHFHHYMNLYFPVVNSKEICVVDIHQRATGPVFIKDEQGVERFFIRRSASTIALDVQSVIEYITCHWPTRIAQVQPKLKAEQLNMFSSKQAFHASMTALLSSLNSEYYKELKQYWNSYSLIPGTAMLAQIFDSEIVRSMEFGILPIISDYTKKHLYYDQQVKYLYNQQHVYPHIREEEGYDLPIYYHIQFIGIMYSTAINKKIDIGRLSTRNGHMHTIFSSMIEGMVDNLVVPEQGNDKEFPTNYHWLIGEIFSYMNHWLDAYNAEENFLEESSYKVFIPSCMNNCLNELYKGLSNGKLTTRFVVNQMYYGVLSNYFSPLLNASLRNSINEHIIAEIPKPLIPPALEFALDGAFALRYHQFSEGNFERITSEKSQILQNLRSFLLGNSKINLSKT